MPILLNDEEMSLARLSVGDDYGDDEIMCAATAKAQIKKVAEWLGEDCTEHRKASYRYNQHYYLARRDCPECQEALNKEAGIE